MHALEWAIMMHATWIASLMTDGAKEFNDDLLDIISSHKQ